MEVQCKENRGGGGPGEGGGGSKGEQIGEG